jgi:tRNA (guanine37-N1)-methyltransferase
MESIDVFCVFPEAVEATLRVGVVGRALERGVVSLRTFDLKEFSPGGRVDDAPFGGGAGMVIRVDVVARAFEEVYGVSAQKVREGRRVVVTEPAGRRVEQGYIREIVAGFEEDEGLTVVCGRYAGMDERVRKVLATEAVSLGDFVLSGGEIVAAALSDAVIRLLRGVLGNAESLVEESFSREGVIGSPQYTRPAVWDGEAVPAVLLSGDHAKIRAWRERQPHGRAGAGTEARRGQRFAPDFPDTTPERRKDK